MSKHTQNTHSYEKKHEKGPDLNFMLFLHTEYINYIQKNFSRITKDVYFHICLNVIYLLVGT